MHKREGRFDLCSCSFDIPLHRLHALGCRVGIKIYRTFTGFLKSIRRNLICGIIGGEMKKLDEMY